MQVYNCGNGVIKIIHYGLFFLFLLVRETETSHLGQGQEHVLAPNNPPAPKLTICSEWKFLQTESLNALRATEWWLIRARLLCGSSEVKLPGGTSWITAQCLPLR